MFVWVKWMIRAGLSGWFLFCCSQVAFAAGCPGQMADYVAYPPFLTSKVKPNVLLILDNSGSMNEFAYHEASGERCGGDSAWTGYEPGTEYYGLFNPNKMYSYDNAHHYFYEDGDTLDDPSTTAIYERSTGSDPNVKKFSGNWLNWWTMRRIDVAKKVLTGGRIAPDQVDTVLEGTETDRDNRRLFNDYTTATDPHGVLTGSLAKNVYYTPFHRGIYSYFDTVDRGAHLGGNSGDMAVMFNAVAADFDSAGDVTGSSCVSTTFTDPVDGSWKNYTQLADDAGEAGTNLGDSGYSYPGYVVAVKVEASDLPVQGLVQKMAGRVRFGYMHFNYEQGGRVRNYVGDNSTRINPHGDTVSALSYNINQQLGETWTPLAETLWEASRYFRQITPQYFSTDFSISNTWDPYYFNDLGIFVPCAKSYIILLSDGAATRDTPPSNSWPYGAATSGLTGDGANYLDDLAFNIHTRDLRDDTAMGEAANLIDQTISLYPVYCFDDSDAARVEMMKAARAGGFIDLNEDGDTCGSVSDSDPSAFVGCAEWDENNDNIPDTYFEAQDGAQMESQLMRAIADILSRTASGTAASVISNSQSGEGAVYQAVFFTESEAEPLTADTVKWYGNVHAMMIDSKGYMREDTNRNATLDMYSDRIVFFDSETGKAELYDPPYDPATSTPAEQNVEIEDINFLWDAHSQLNSPSLNTTTQRTYASSPTPFQRYLFTDSINTGSSVSLSNVDSSNEMAFTPAFVNDSANDNYFFLNPKETGFSEADMITEAQNIIRFVRGEEGLTQPMTGQAYRDRTLDTDGDGTDDTVYRLGDIVNSTPTVVAQPSEDYDLLYGDYSYRSFRKRYQDRRTVVYAGANDGMLHAFNGGFYDRSRKITLTRPEVWDSTAYAGAGGFVADPNVTVTEFALGAELWGYVPNAVLPHLKWLKEALNEQRHVYQVDLKPRVFDAQIFTEENVCSSSGRLDEDCVHPYGWGTVLVGGLRLGGGPIGVDTDNDGACDMEFGSAYFAIDITNPEAPPELLWSFADSSLGFSTSYPTAMRVGEKWFVVLGSGPQNYEAIREVVPSVVYGGSDQTSNLYVLDAEDGSLAHTFSMDGHSFAASPIAVDLDLAATGGAYDREWSGEAIYVATDGSDSGLEGQIYRFKTTQSDGSPEENPANWTKGLFFDPNSVAGDSQHISTALSVSRDENGEVWIYFGTGRFWSILDRQSPYFSYQNAFYGIKEPTDSTGNLTYTTVGAKETSLLNVSSTEITDQDSAAFNSVMTDIEQNYAGWYREFPSAGERNLGQAAVLGDIVTFSTFIPDNNLCASEGESYLYALHYKTGTAYYEGVLSLPDGADADDLDADGVDDTTNRVIYRVSIGKGFSTTPNIHTGEEDGSRAFLQTSTGAIIPAQQSNPGLTKSGKTSWRQED